MNRMMKIWRGIYFDDWANYANHSEKLILQIKLPPSIHLYGFSLRGHLLSAGRYRLQYKRQALID